jgi:AcrR family transcriptional regulator
MPALRARKIPKKRRKSPQIALRRAPIQARGLETFEHILAITGRLLDEFGADAITTNLIAKAAGVNVATLYQYFPNKRAILVQLFLRQAEQRKRMVEEAFARSVASGSDWQTAISAAIDAVHSVRQDAPGVLPLRQAMRSDPALLVYDREEAHSLSQWLARELEQSAALSRDSADLVARCTIEGVRALLDLGQLDKSFRHDRILAQAKELAARYLAPYFDQSARRRAAPARKPR